jgi:acyl-[acyl-carrier-protein] desaturase
MAPTIQVDRSLVEDLAALRPRHTSLLSRAERSRCVERGTAMLYRWYVAHGQQTRNWNPDASFEWKKVRRDQPPDTATLIRGFFAVEQFVPDYVGMLLASIRQSYGRSQFHIRWGAEEAKHADLWRNALLSMGTMTPDAADEYAADLRQRRAELQWDHPLRMLFYTVLQERATQITYVNVGRAFSGDRDVRLPAERDPAMAAVCRTIAIDEAAHYAFFLEVARLNLYYFPEDSVEALVAVVRHFTMPARHVIPEYEHFGRVLHDHGVFGRRIHYIDVVAVALRQLGTRGLHALEEGVRRSRSLGGDVSASATAFESLDAGYIEGCVAKLFARFRGFAARLDIDHIVDSSFAAVPRSASC